MKGSYSNTGWFFFFFFALNIFTQDYPLGWVPLQMRGPARNIAQTYKNNIYTKHDMYNYKNMYTGKVIYSTFMLNIVQAVLT